MDGVKATRYIPLPSRVQMGRWRDAGSQSAIILSPGAVITPTRNFKRTGYADLLVQLLKQPAASKFGRDGDIDLRRIFLNQNRNFSKLPHTGRALLDNRYSSEPVELRL